MHRKIILTLALLMLPVWLVLPRAAAEDKPLVHPLFADHMVLQRELPAPVWGWTTPGREVPGRLLPGGPTQDRPGEARGVRLP